MNMTRPLWCLAITLATLSTAAKADETYPPGTECANLRTIAERLLCGRQELQRGDAATKQNVPPPPYDGYSPDPDQAQPPPGTRISPAPQLPNTNAIPVTPSPPRP